MPSLPTMSSSSSAKPTLVLTKKAVHKHTSKQLMPQQNLMRSGFQCSSPGRTYTDRRFRFNRDEHSFYGSIHESWKALRRSTICTYFSLSSPRCSVQNLNDIPPPLLSWCFQQELMPLRQAASRWKQSTAWRWGHFQRENSPPRVDLQLYITQAQKHEGVAVKPSIFASSCEVVANNEDDKTNYYSTAHQ